MYVVNGLEKSLLDGGIFKMLKILKELQKVEADKRVNVLRSIERPAVPSIGESKNNQNPSKT